MDGTTPAGAWALKDGRGTVGSGGGTFSLTADVRSGGVSNAGIVRDANGTIHPGQVGLWAGSGSAAVKGDNFKVRSLNADLALDGRFSPTTSARAASSAGAMSCVAPATRRKVLRRIASESAILPEGESATSVSEFGRCRSARYGYRVQFSYG